MKKVIPVVLLISFTLLGLFFYNETKTPRNDLRAYGNVDREYVLVSFDTSGIVQTLYVDQGDYVKAGDKLAVVDSQKLDIKINQLIAKKKSLSNKLLKAENGFRKDEIEKAAAMVALAEAEMNLANLNYERKANVARQTKGGVSPAELDSFLSQKKIAFQNYKIAQSDYNLKKEGERKEDIDALKADIEAIDAEIDYQNSLVRDTILTSPIDGFINNKLTEEGELAVVNKPAFKILKVSPVYIKAYVSETALGKISLGTETEIYTDSYAEPLGGTITFISGQAEFTPKFVQTEELRTSLVYMVKIKTEDNTYLKQGMPVTVVFKAGK